MAKDYLVMVLTEPTEGNEVAFNEYYEETHIDEVFQTTNFTSAQRYKIAGQAGEGSPLPYLAVYETQGDSAEAVLADLAARRGEREQSDTLNRRTGRAWVFEPVGKKHVKSK